MNNTTNLKYEEYSQYYARLCSLVKYSNTRVEWLGDVDRDNVPIYRFNNITLPVKLMISIMKPNFNFIDYNKIINLDVKYNCKRQIYLDLPMNKNQSKELGKRDYDEILNLYKKGMSTKKIADIYNINRRIISNYVINNYLIKNN
jgi:hypothetical protein